MEIYTLPAFFEPHRVTPVRVHDYHSAQEIEKQKVNLEHHTISFLQEGTKEVFAGSEPISINSSHFLWMKAGHCLMTEKLSSENQKYRSVLFFFSDEVLQEIARKHFQSGKGKTEQKYVEAIPYDNYLRTFVNSLLDIRQFDHNAQSQLLLVKLDELVLYLKNKLGDSLLSLLSGSTDSRSQNFLNVVENNRLNRLSLGELAFLSNMSLSTFKREFHKHFGTSPSKWFQQKRLEHAAFLLENQAKRPSDIFLDAGYESLSNFIQAFKGKYGVTPKQFQRKTD